MDPSTSTNLLDVFHMAPDSLTACKCAGVLKALRAVCRTARRVATPLVSTLTIDTGNTAQQGFLQQCRIRKLRVQGGDAVLRDGQMVLCSSHTGDSYTTARICTVYVDNSIYCTIDMSTYLYDMYMQALPPLRGLNRT